MAAWLDEQHDKQSPYRAKRYRRTPGRAVQVAGSEQKLAQFLGLSLQEMRNRAAGEADPPVAVFLALVDIVAANYLTPAALSNLARQASPKRPTT